MSNPTNAVMIFCMRLGYTTGSRARETRDDGGQGLHVWLEGDVRGDAPPPATRLEIFNELIHGPDQDVRAVEDVVGRELCPTRCQLFRDLAPRVGDDDSL